MLNAQVGVSVRDSFLMHKLENLINKYSYTVRAVLNLTT